MATDTRYQPLPPARRCGVPGCWCTPPEPPAKDYGTVEAAPGERIVPREWDDLADPITRLPPGRLVLG